jgi:hypothetical protein
MNLISKGEIMKIIISIFLVIVVTLSCLSFISSVSYKLIIQNRGEIGAVVNQLAGKTTPRESQPGEPEKTEWEEKLHRIVSEVQYFVSRYERPGAVLRWKQLNPNLFFYDSAFQFKEEISHEAYLKCQRGLTGYRLSLYPDDELIEQRRMYFEHAKNSALMTNTTFSEDKLFEEELLKTLDMVFEHDFCTSEIDNKE